MEAEANQRVVRLDLSTYDVVRDAVDRAERTGNKPLIWTQIGVHSPEAATLAEAAGLPYVADRCLMVDHASMA